MSSLACGHRIISVANLDEAKNLVNVSSSQGPTRDGRFKPDIAAPGTDIVAAKGFGGSSQPWIPMTGTSMASPYVCGVAAKMLAYNPSLTAAQILGILHHTAKPIDPADPSWSDQAGFGAIDPTAAVNEVK